VCREKVIICCDVVTPKGSPLRVQGKDSIAIIADTLAGITPACAGKSY